MAIHTCGNCHVEFHHKGDYDKHIARKNKCLSYEELCKIGIECGVCHEKFSNQRNCTRHMKTCTNKPNDTDNTDNTNNNNDDTDTNTNDNNESNESDESNSEASQPTVQNKSSTDDDSTFQYSCTYCDKKFLREFSIARHHKLCTSKKAFDEEAVKKFDIKKLIEENINLRRINKNLQDKLDSINPEVEHMRRALQTINTMRSFQMQIASMK